MCKKIVREYIRLQCLKLAYKNDCEKHDKILKIAKKNSKFVFETKTPNKKRHKG
jgi:hypothetical protein